MSSQTRDEKANTAAQLGQGLFLHIKSRPPCPPDSMSEATSSTPTAAQEEFNQLFNQNLSLERHPEDQTKEEEEQEGDDRTEEDKHRAQRINEAMRIPVFDRIGAYSLPHKSFDSGRTTGVKGVIADARSFDQARKAGWKAPSGSTIGAGREAGTVAMLQKKDGESDISSDDEEFLERWREERRMQMQMEGTDIRNRRTSPSMRLYERFDEVDALGYLDAIEKVGRETVVCVFVYDHEVCLVTLPSALVFPLLTILSVM